MFHFISTNFCKKQLAWNRNTLRCKVCGRMAGFRWKYDDSLRIYLYRGFEDIRQQIEEDPETYQITGSQDILGEVTFSDFDTFIEEVREQTRILENLLREDETQTNAQGGSKIEHEIVLPEQYSNPMR